MEREKVNIMVGKFQPFTLGHLKCLLRIRETLDVPTLLCVIPGNGDAFHPFTDRVQDEMYERLMNEYPDLFADICYVKNAFIESWALAARERGLKPISWTCGTDRVESYENMVEKYGPGYDISGEFRVFVLDRYDDNISGTSVRNALLNDDYGEFKRQMPECLHCMYDELRMVMLGEIAPSFE